MKLHTRTKNCHGNYVYFYDLIKDTEGLEGNPSTVINHSINLNQSTLNYKLLVEDNICLNLNIDLNMFKDEPSFNKDQMLFGINDNIINNALSAEDKSIAYNVVESDIVNFFKESYLTKDAVENIKYNGNKCPFKIFVPSKTTSFEDYNLMVYTNNSDEPEITHTYTSDTLTLDVSPLAPPWTDIISDISIAASKPAINEDDKVTLTLTTENNSITEVYAEAVFGIVSKTRIALTNGVGTVNVMSLGLSVGDPIRIKFGYLLFSGVTEYTNTVT